jgi:hypothetical protein
MPHVYAPVPRSSKVEQELAKEAASGSKPSKAPTTIAGKKCKLLKSRQ